MALLQIADPKAKEKAKIDNSSKDIAIGIDLGTSNTVVSYYNLEKQEVEIIPINGKYLLKSIVWFKNNTAIVGEYPKHNEEEQYFFTSMKKYMGKAYSDIKEESLTFQVNKHDSDKTLRIKVSDNKELYLEEIIAEIIKKVKLEAENYLKCNVSKAVITVPAYFDEAARVATKNAAKLASIDVLRLINEPTSAAFAYGLEEHKEGIYIVYDLGGGTFDVSILKLQKGIFKVLATLGDLSLGGDDIDEILLNEIIKSINIESTLDNHNNLLLIAREIKEELSSCANVIKEFTLNGKNYTFEIEKTYFNKIIKPLIDRTMTLLDSALKDSKESIKDIKAVILVGGSTRLSCIQEIIEKKYNIKTLCSINPDEVVSIGASYQAANLTGLTNSSLLLDVIPLSLGLEIAGGIVEKIIPRNSSIPIAKAQEFTTSKDDQVSMMIHVLQGERELVQDLRSLGKFTLTSIPKMKAGKARIKVIFTVDADGLLRVSAEEQTTKTKQSIEIKPTWGISIDDMRNMLESSMINAKSDIENRLLNESISEANNVIYATEQAIKEDNKLLVDNELKIINKAIMGLQDACQSRNRDLIQENLKILNSSTDNFAHRRMTFYAKKALEGKKVHEVKKILGKTD